MSIVTSTDLSPIVVMEAINHDCRLLDRLGRELADAIRDQATVERDYELAIERVKLELFDEYKSRKERLPAEDMRRALAHQRVNPDLYGRFLMARANANALKAHARTVEAALSGRQTLLGVLRAEYAAGVA
jgi:hypothetical protein